MKKTIITITVIFGFIMSGCNEPVDIIQNETPVVSDFTITGLSAVADGSPKIVNIQPKTGKSLGIITVYYAGTSGTVYTKSASAPSAVGKYAVTFDVAAAEGFNEANGLSAGTLIISRKTDINDAPSVDENPVDDEPPSDNEHPIDNEPTTDDNYPVDDEPPSDNEHPIDNEPTTDDNYPTDDEPPSDNEYPIDNEPTIDDNYPTDDEPPADDEPPTDMEEISGSQLIIDFEDNAWAGGNPKSYNNRSVTFNDYVWSVSGITLMDDSDHYNGSRGIRLRGNKSSDSGNINRLELVSFLPDGIKYISFNYASYGAHKSGKIELYYQKENADWVKTGEVTAPLWADENKMQEALFNINETGKIRFKIEKVNVSSNTSSVNIDNIIIAY